MTYQGVRKPVTEMTTDGPMTIIPYSEWIRQLVDGLRAGDSLLTDFLDWENEYFAWTRQADQPAPRPRRQVTGKPQRKRRNP